MVALGQLVALGLSYEEVRARARRGRLMPIHRGVYAVGHRSLVPRAHLIAALLACGADAFLSHRSAAAVWGLREIATARVEVTVPTSCARGRDRLVIHRTSVIHPQDVRRRDGLRVSSVPRMLIELAVRETPAELDRLITQAARRRLLDLEAVQRALERHARRPGARVAARALAAYLPRPDRKSGLEQAFDLLIADTDIPDPLRNVTIDGWEIDFYWPQARLAVELDGRPYHVTVRDQEKDRFKDAKLLRHGINVLRITDTRFELDPEGVREDVRHLSRSPAT